MSVVVQNPLTRGDQGAAVTELQMRLSGFRGTLPDGDYGPGTELQVQAFQRIYMKESTPSGQADAETMKRIAEFGEAYPFDFKQLDCPCGQCGGFGQGRFKGLYRYNNKLEVYHRYEYPGMHRMLLWCVRAAYLYAAQKGWKLTISSAYRCAIDNAKHGRNSTNHHGKAIDLDIIGNGGTDRQRCDTLRSMLQEHANCQNGWNVPNRKAYEPANIAPTWVHLDVRSYAPKYLDERYFVKSAQALDAVVP